MTFCQHIEARRIAKDFNLWRCQNIDCDKYFYKKEKIKMENELDRATSGVACMFVSNCEAQTAENKRMKINIEKLENALNAIYYSPGVSADICTIIEIVLDKRTAGEN